MVTGVLFLVPVRRIPNVIPDRRDTHQIRDSNTANGQSGIAAAGGLAMTNTTNHSDSYSQGLIIGFRMVQVAIGITVSDLVCLCRSYRLLCLRHDLCPGWTVRIGSAHLLVRTKEGCGSVRLLSICSTLQYCHHSSHLSPLYRG
jgi:hypothetical protein